MTVIEVILLCAGGMPLFDSLIHCLRHGGHRRLQQQGAERRRVQQPVL